MKATLRFSVARACLLLTGTIALVVNVGRGGEPAAPSKSPSREVRFSEHLVWNDFSYPFGGQAIDLNGDGYLDLTVPDTAGFLLMEPVVGEAAEPTVPDQGNNLPAISKGPPIRNSNVYWFENDHRGGFIRHYIVKDDVNRRLERHIWADLNRDHLPDLVIVDNFLGDIIWYQNPGPAAVQRGDPWKKRFVAKGEMLGAVDVTVADFDGDGWPDVAGAGWRLGNCFKWFKNPGENAPEQWTGWTIDSGFSHATSALAGDINGDGRPDLLTTSSTSRAVMWYENLGDPAARGWRRNVIELTPGGREPAFTLFADLNRDGKLDIILAWGGYGNGRDGMVIWYEQSDVVEGRVQWKKHAIGSMTAVTHLALGDLNGDGALDVAASGFMPGEIAWFENPGNPGARWSKHVLKRGWPNANQIVIGDFDRDGRADIAAVADYGAMELRWWRNEGPQ